MEVCFGTGQKISPEKKNEEKIWQLIVIMTIRASEMLKGTDSKRFIK